jgi:hypothetical protein
MLWGTDNIFKLHVYLCLWHVRMGGGMHFLVSKCHGTCMIDCLQRCKAASDVASSIQWELFPPFSV